MIRKITYGLAIVFLMVGSGLLVNFVDKGKIRLNKTNAMEELVMKVSEIMLLPEEIPTLARVEDKNNLGKFDFFRKAENGDSVLIFPEAKKAILYRESINRIIEVTNLSEAEQQKIENTVPTAIKIKVTVYNGSGKSGIASKLADEVLADIDNLEVLSKKDAKGTYEQTVVVDLSNKYGEVADGLAEALDGKTIDMPEGEIRPEGDILIIAGKDRE